MLGSATALIPPERARLRVSHEERFATGVVERLEARRLRANEGPATGRAVLRNNIPPRLANDGREVRV